MSSNIIMIAALFATSALKAAGLAALNYPIPIGNWHPCTNNPWFLNMDEKKTYKPSWNETLRQQLQKLKHQKQPDDPSLRLVILGTGNELNGDDAAGVWIARSLQLLPDLPENILVLDGGDVPENWNGKIIRFQPDYLLMIDAADLGIPAGEIRYLEPDEVHGGMGTHGLSLGDLAQLWTAQTGCQTGILGIQVQHLTFAAALSQPVQKSACEIAAALTAISGHL